MSVETRTFDNERGDPVVVLVSTGTHDVSRIVNALAVGTCEQGDLAQKIVKQLRRHNTGRAALALLRDHGGPDFTQHTDTDTDATVTQKVREIAAEWDQRGATWCMTRITQLLERP